MVSVLIQIEIEIDIEHTGLQKKPIRMIGLIRFTKSTNLNRKSRVSIWNFKRFFRYHLLEL